MSHSDVLNFEIKNTGSQNVNVIILFLEDQENSDIFSRSNSPVMNTIFSFIISRLLLFLGIIISIIDIIVMLVTLKNNKDIKRNY